MVSTGTLLLMGVIAALTAIVPLGVMAFLRGRGGRWRDFLVGAGTFFLFALVLEQILHTLVFTSPLGPVLQGNIWLYGLYGGLAAGVFEEAGRFAAFKLVLRERREHRERQPRWEQLRVSRVPWAWLPSRGRWRRALLRRHP